MTNWKKLIITLTLLAGVLSAQAATLILKDGSRLEGDLDKIHKGVYFFKTGFAGVLEIPQDQVTSLQSTEPVSLRTASGEVFQGSVAPGQNGTVTVSSSAGTVSTGLDTVVSGWKPGAKDPVVADREAELEGQLRKWKYTAGLDVGGSSGNTSNFNSTIQAQAVLEGPTDRLVMYGSYKYKKYKNSDGMWEKSEDEQKGGINYTNFFSEKLGWYVREEIERDSFEGIDFRSTSAGGLSYRFVNRDRLHVEGNAGISYRYESYSDSTPDDGFPGLDFGLNIDWQFADWGKLVTKITYIPSIDDFGDYLVTHESGVDIPLGTSDNWVMRFGLSNTYNSNPGAGRDKMDTTYFARLILTWE